MVKQFPFQGDEREWFGKLHAGRCGVLQIVLGTSITVLGILYHLYRENGGIYALIGCPLCGGIMILAGICGVVVAKSDLTTSASMGMSILSSIAALSIFILFAVFFGAADAKLNQAAYPDIPVTIDVLLMVASFIAVIVAIVQAAKCCNSEEVSQTVKLLL